MGIPMSNGSNYLHHEEKKETFAEKNKNMHAGLPVRSKLRKGG